MHGVPHLLRYIEIHLAEPRHHFMYGVLRVYELGRDDAARDDDHALGQTFLTRYEHVGERYQCLQRMAHDIVALPYAMPKGEQPSLPKDYQEPLGVSSVSRSRIANIRFENDQDFRDMHNS
jgi:hypothetical protein